MTSFESVLLNAINFKNGTRYRFQDLVQWSMSKDNLKRTEGVILYQIFDCYVLINPKNKKNVRKKM